MEPFLSPYNDKRIDYFASQPHYLIKDATKDVWLRLIEGSTVKELITQYRDKEKHRYHNLRIEIDGVCAITIRPKNIPCDSWLELMGDFVYVIIPPDERWMKYEDKLVLDQLMARGPRRLLDETYPATAKDFEDAEPKLDPNQLKQPIIVGTAGEFETK